MSVGFGVTLPDSWTWSALKYSTRCLNRGTAPEYVDDGQVRAISQAANQTGGLDWDRTRFHRCFGNPRLLRGYLISDDLLINSTGTGTLGRIGYFISGPDERPCIADGHLTVARANQTLIHPRFMYYWLSSSPFQEYIFSALTVGATSQIELSRERLAAAPIALPPLVDQRRIVEFLEFETTRIDSLIRNYRKATDTLDRRTKLVVDQLIEQAGPPVPLKYSVQFREGPGIMAFDFRNHGVPLVRIAGLESGEVTLRGANYLDSEMANSKWKKFRLQLGDYVISGSATMGEISVVKDPDVVGSIPYTGLIILRPATGSVSMEYVAIAMDSSMFTRQIDLLKAGAMMQHFGPTHLSQITLPLPHRGRQDEIATTVRELCEQASRLKVSIDRQILLLRERRQALITAAVTGQIDVTSARGVDV